mgnify:CR=1 FL=1
MANTNDLYKTSFAQHGNAFQDTNAAVTPDDGMIICAITMLTNTTFTAMSAADDDEVSSNASFGLTAGETGAGSGGVVISAANVFSAGITIFGRWSSVTPTAASEGGIICYFAPR